MSVRYKIEQFQNRPWTNIEQDLNTQGSNGWDLHELQYQTAIFKSSNGGASATTAFGEPLAIPLTPVIQLDAIYGITSNDYETFTATTGNVESSGSVFLTHTGTGAYGYGVIRSRRLLRYRPGQGALARFTAGFSTPHSDTIQRAGLFAQEQGLFIGNEGTNFGVTRQNGGKAHIYRVDITNDNAGGAGVSASIELNGTTYNVDLTSSGTEDEIASQISNDSAFTGFYTTEAISSSVFFSATSLGNRTGNTNFTTNDGTLVGSVATIQSGSDNVLSFTSQSDFSIDTLDGNGPSGMVLDTTKINVYQINFRWLGVGEIRYAIENQDSGDMIFFHHEHFTNKNEVPHLDNPSFKIGYIAANLTANTVTDVHTYGSSMMGAIEGQIEITGFPTAVSKTQGTGLTANQLHHLLTIRNNLIYKNKINLRALKLKQTSCAFKGTDPGELLIYLNSTGFSGTHIFNSVGDDSNTSISTVGGTFTNPGAPLAIFTIAPGGSVVVDLEELNIVLPPQNTLTLVLRSGSSINNPIGGLTFSEF